MKETGGYLVALLLLWRDTEAIVEQHIERTAWGIPGPSSAT